LRRLCDEQNLLLFMDEVQCGHFRTGRFQSFQRILEDHPEPDFLPDAVSMAKSLGAGFPIGAFWVRSPYADLLNAGTHGTTYGGSPLACSVALKVLEVIEREHLAENARTVGEYLKNGLQAATRKYPRVFQEVRGLGLMIGLQLASNIPSLPGDPNKTQAVRFANLLHNAGMLAIPAGAQILRLLPPLNLRHTEAEEGLRIFDSIAAGLAR
jgi:acetylornithine/succinyldiaminopimelate/putrescine aminotransferase